MLADWPIKRGTDWCARIIRAPLDPAAGYRAALRDHLPNAQRVIDHFHAVELANTAIDDARRRVQEDTLGHRGHKRDPRFRVRRAILVRYDRLSEERFEWIRTTLATGDPDGEAAAARLSKELLRAVYAAVDEAHARQRPTEFRQYCAEADVPDVTRLARTVDRWHNEILAYHSTNGASNGLVENVHMLAEKIRRNSHGFTNIDNYRRRLIGRLGLQWATVPSRRIRGRKPHSAT